MARVIHIRPSNDGQTLATVLRKILGETVPWSEVKRRIAKRYVTVNGNLCVDEARRLRAGDVLHLFDEARPPLPGEDDIRIYHLDEHLVVIEKPAGLTTLRHREETDLPRQRKDKAPTLDELLQRKLTALYYAQRPTRPNPRSALARRSPNPPHPPPALRSRGLPRPPPPAHPLSGPVVPAQTSRPGAEPPAAVPKRFGDRPPVLRPVHRLDRETSGLMLFALSPHAETTLERDFARHAIDRRYLAIVHGHLTDPRTVESWIVRDRGDGLRGSSALGRASEPAGGQRAVTHIRPVETVGAYSIIECQLETGRTHQIRIHLSELGHPLAGEKLYVRRPDTDPGPALTSPAPLPRHALHSYKLSFTHPVTGQALSFESPWPKDLARFLRRLRDPTMGEHRGV